jgi:NAD(P)H dehydrogenase (quinone)
VSVESDDSLTIVREGTPSMTIVVTGATGHLGRLVVENLLDRGHPADQIVATGRNTDPLADLADRSVHIAAVDFDHPASLKEAFDGADIVLLVSSNAIGHRVRQHTNAIDAAAATGVKRMAYTSAPHADTTDLVLAPDHKATEEHLLGSGLQFTVLRNGWYTENYLAALDHARSTGTIVASVGDGRVASAPRSDYAAAAAVVLTEPGHENQVYELSGDHAWTHDELAAAATEILKREVTYQPVTPDEHLDILRAAGLDDATAQFLVTLDGDTRRGLLAETSGDLRHLIGRPTTPLLEALHTALAGRQ